MEIGTILGITAIGIIVIVLVVGYVYLSCIRGGEYSDGYDTVDDVL